MGDVERRDVAFGRKHLDLPAAELRMLGEELEDHGDARLQTGLPAPRDLHPILIGSAIETHRMEVLLQRAVRSEEHTSELQSLMRISYAVFCLKKKKSTTKLHKYMTALVLYA